MVTKGELTGTCIYPTLIILYVSISPHA